MRSRTENFVLDGCIETAELRHHREMVKACADERRKLVTASDPWSIERKTPWTVVGETSAVPAERFRVVLDEKNLACEIEQLQRTAGTLDTAGDHVGSIFDVVMDRQVFIGGHPAAIGCKVRCYADLAFSIHGQSGRIIKETKS